MEPGICQNGTLSGPSNGEATAQIANQIDSQDIVAGADLHSICAASCPTAATEQLASQDNWMMVCKKHGPNQRPTAHSIFPNSLKDLLRSELWSLTTLFYTL